MYDYNYIPGSHTEQSFYINFHLENISHAHVLSHYAHLWPDNHAPNQPHCQGPLNDWLEKKGNTLHAVEAKCQKPSITTCMYILKQKYYMSKMETKQWVEKSDYSPVLRQVFYSVEVVSMHTHSVDTGEALVAMVGEELHLDKAVCLGLFVLLGGNIQ